MSCDNTWSAGAFRPVRASKRRSFLGARFARLRASREIYCRITNVDRNLPFLLLALRAELVGELRKRDRLTTDHYECTWDLLSSIPSLERPGLSVPEETVAFNTENPAHSQARLVDRNR